MVSDTFESKIQRNTALLSSATGVAADADKGARFSTRVIAASVISRSWVRSGDRRLGRLWPMFFSFPHLLFFF